MITPQQSPVLTQPLSDNPESNHVRKESNHYGQAYHWVGVYIDDKFFLTTHSAYQKVQALDNQIAQQKKRLENPNKINVSKIEKNEEDNRQIPINQIKKRKNSLQSAKSRQCKTQINELKALKAKFEIERQLAEEEMNFNKTIQVRKRRQLREAATFVIRNPKQRSLQFKQPKQRKSSIKNVFMLAPHELSCSNRKNYQQRQSQSFSRQKEVNSFNFNTKAQNEKEVKQFKTIDPNHLKNNEGTVLDGSNTVKRSIHSQSRYQQNQQNNQNLSKSKQKSFVITSRKLSSAHSKEQKDGLISIVKENKKKQSSVIINSEDQLQRLNKKLKQMQQKLILVEKKQKQLQQMEKHKQKIKHEIQSQTPKDCQSQTQSKKSQNIKGIKMKANKQKNETKRKQQQQNQQQVKAIDEQKIKKQQRATIFTIRQQKYKKLGITSSTVVYNYNQQKQKSLKQIQQLNTKQKMSKEIDQLKRVIKQLRIQKIKQQTLISQLQMKNKRKSSFKDEESLRSNNNEITFNGQDLYNDQKTNSNVKSHTNSNNKSFSQKSMLQTLNQKQEQLINQIKQQNSLDMIQSNDNKPLNKKEPRRFLKLDVNNLYKKKLSSSFTNNNTHANQIIPNVNNIHYQTIKQQVTEKKIPNNKQVNSEVKKQQIKRNLVQKKDDNPQQLQKQSLSLIKKGRIMKQFFNKQKLHVSSSNNESEREIFLKQNRTLQSFDQLLNENSKQIITQLTYPQINIPQIQIIQSFPIPQLPPPPSLQTQQGQILSQAKKICQIFEIKLKGNQQLQFKRFKNCILLKNIENNQAIVWHFSGKFYVGGWLQKNQSGEDHKNGDGFEYVPEKHYYRGQFSHGKRNGQGTMVMMNGNVYKGQWLNGEKHGKGIFYEKINNSYYEGDWKEGKKDGLGIYKVSDKQFYTGGFQNSLRAGFGFELFSNKDIYEGEYKEGKFNGKGRYFWSNGSAYIGEFVDGQRSGFGKWVSSLTDGDIYVGYYHKDKKQGKGKYMWYKGCTFQGNFLCDLKHGQGRVQYPDGREVKGIWEYGKLKNVLKSQNQTQSRVENEYNLSFQEIQPRIRPNIPRVQETPSKRMQESRLVQGV